MFRTSDTQRQAKQSLYYEIQCIFINTSTENTNHETNICGFYKHLFDLNRRFEPESSSTSAHTPPLRY